MKKFVLIALMLSISTGMVVARQDQRLRQNEEGRPPSIEDLVEGFYVSRFQEELGVNDEQFVKILPLLRQSFRDRRDKAQKRARALNELRQMLESGASDEEIKNQIREVDQAGSAITEAQQKYITSIDSMLSPRQQAKWRIFQVRIEQRIRRMIDRSRNPGGPGMRPRPPQ